jgi:prevent-host-death family protein
VRAGGVGSPRAGRGGLGALARNGGGAEPGLCRIAGAGAERVRPPVTLVRSCAFLPRNGHCTVLPSVHGLSADQTHLSDLVAEARHSHRPITISENGKPVAALINFNDLADLEDRAALAAHLADKAAGRGGITLDELDTALDRIDAATLS